MRIRTSDNNEQQIEELTYGKEYKVVSSHNIKLSHIRVLTKVQTTDPRMRMYL